MLKYVVERVVKNDIEVLYMCEDKAEAKAKALEIFETEPRNGTIRLISAEYNEAGERIVNRYKQYDAWW